MSASERGRSVQDRLLQRARRSGEDFQALLTRYALERLMYRLSQSDLHDRFVLKGAYVFLLWEGDMHRPTQDLDLLGYQSPDPQAVEAAFRRICAVEVADDGVQFDADSVSAESIRDQAVYDGLRLTLMAGIGTARLPLQIDIGFGDAVVPEPIEASFPPLLDFPAPTMRAYPRESVVAEKLHGLVLFGMATSRMKDLYDLRYLANHFSFEGADVTAAISATFERRDTPIPDPPPQALTATFAEDAEKRQQWTAFLRRTQLVDEALDLREVVDDLQVFLLPPVKACASNQDFEHKWTPGGRWSSR
jgi:predicted nucleotidyltransferase component of viral defense system